MLNSKRLTRQAGSEDFLQAEFQLEMLWNKNDLLRRTRL
jgi:hypothetical protein